MKNVMDKICDYIIQQVQENSILSGFQLIVDYADIYEKFSPELNQFIQDLIEEELNKREEVADVIQDVDGFDVVLYTSYAPNYSPEDEEDEFKNYINYGGL